MALFYHIFFFVVIEQNHTSDRLKKKTHTFLNERKREKKDRNENLESTSV